MTDPDSLGDRRYRSGKGSRPMKARHLPLFTHTQSNPESIL